MTARRAFFCEAATVDTSSWCEYHRTVVFPSFARSEQRYKSPHEQVAALSPAPRSSSTSSDRNSSPTVITAGGSCLGDHLSAAALTSVTKSRAPSLCSSRQTKHQRYRLWCQFSRKPANARAWHAVSSTPNNLLEHRPSWPKASLGDHSRPAGFNIAGPHLPTPIDNCQHAARRDAIAPVRHSGVRSGYIEDVRRIKPSTNAGSGLALGSTPSLRLTSATRRTPSS